MLLFIYVKLRMDNVSDLVVLDSEDTDVYRMCMSKQHMSLFKFVAI